MHIGGGNVEIPTFFLALCRCRLYRIQKRDPTVCKVMKNDLTSDLINDLSGQFPGEFVVSVARFKSSTTQCDVHFVTVFPRGVNRQQQDTLFPVGALQSSVLLFKHGCFCLQKK